MDVVPERAECPTPTTTKGRTTPAHLARETGGRASRHPGDSPRSRSSTESRWTRGRSLPAPSRPITAGRQALRARRLYVIRSASHPSGGLRDRLGRWWDKANPGAVHDSELFRRDILSRLATIKLSEIAEAVACSKASASDIRRGKWTPHVSTWGGAGRACRRRDEPDSPLLTRRIRPSRRTGRRRLAGSCASVNSESGRRRGRAAGRGAITEARGQLSLFQAR